MQKLTVLLLALASTAVDAEVFKCTGKSGKAVYQAKPCPSTEKELQLEIKPDLAKQAEAKAKLEAIQAEYETNKAAQQEAEKQNAQQQREAEKLELERQNAIAQQEQAEAQRRQADALEQQNQQNNRPVYITPHLPPHHDPIDRPSLQRPPLNPPTP